jgi:hypothetical protein
MASDRTVYTAGEGSMFIQECGPGNSWDFLGCHEMGDTTQPLGDITPFYCQGENQGEYKIAGSFRGAQGLVTATITSQLESVARLLEEVGIKPTFLYVFKAFCGPRDAGDVQPGNRVFIYDTTFITSRGLPTLSARTPENNAESTQNFDISTHTLIEAWGISSRRVTISETEDITGIATCPVHQCGTDCVNPCDTIYAGTKDTDSSPSTSASLLVSTDKGGSFTAAASDPFGAAEDIQPVVCFATSSEGTRVLVGSGTTDGATRAVVNYSDDSGATFAGEIEVDGGAVGDYFSTPNAIFALDQYHIWAVTYATGGGGNSINFSQNSGASFESQGDDQVAAEGLNCIHFVDKNTGWVGGDNNTVGRTDDGGAVWSPVAGPSTKGAGDHILAIAVLSASHIIIGYNAGGVGELWHTLNGDAATPTWTQISLKVTLTAINSIKFSNPYIGYLVGDSAGNNNLLRTVNGGNKWEIVEMTTNAGLNDLVICKNNNNKVFFSGDASGGTGYIGRAQSQ